MMREPWFWRSDSLAARAAAFSMTPLSVIYDSAQRARWRLTSPAKAPAPIICIGNATLGGGGKTPFAIAVQKLLAAEGLDCRFLTRGYGGAETGPLKVDLQKHDARDVGDEALLLVRHAPVWIARDRREGAKAAAQDGADVIIMDDGFQNPTVAKIFSVLLIDAGEPAGNGRVFPAGALREPLARARARADAAVFVGADEKSAERAAAAHGSQFAAWPAPVDAPTPGRVVAFTGIGKPQKFFDLLKAEGFDLAHTLAFPDHHHFSDHDRKALARLSKAKEAPLITTEKDHVRLPASFAQTVMTLPIAMTINKPALLTNMMLSTLNRKPASP